MKCGKWRFALLSSFFYYYFVGGVPTYFEGGQRDALEGNIGVSKQDLSLVPAKSQRVNNSRRLREVLFILQGCVQLMVGGSVKHALFCIGMGHVVSHLSVHLCGLI